jgi:hypothetical protein
LKKIVAISFLLIQLFSIGGNLLLHQCLEIRSEIFYNSQTQKGLYNVRDLTEIRIPVKITISSSWQRYQDVSGQIQFGAVSYNYVKMKLTKDAIYLMCIPNYQSTHLKGDNVIDAKAIKEIPVPKKDHVPFPKFVSLLNAYSPFKQFYFTAFTKLVSKSVLVKDEAPIEHDVEIPIQPPRTYC